MNALAEEYGFIVAYPNQSQAANASLCWNWFSPEHQKRGRGEPAIIAGISKIVADYDIDAARVFVAGLSAGGAMAAVMGIFLQRSRPCVVMGAKAGGRGNCAAVATTAHAFAPSSFMAARTKSSILRTARTSSRRGLVRASSGRSSPLFVRIREQLPVTRPGRWSLSNGLSTEAGMPGPGAAQTAPTPIRRDPTLREKCSDSFWKSRSAGYHDAE
jgi:poly(3-hydroxybutyrate) depolymerase